MLTAYLCSLLFNLRSDCSLPSYIFSKACAVPRGASCNLSVIMKRVCNRRKHFHEIWHWQVTLTCVVIGDARPLNLPCVWVRFSVQLSLVQV
jgi:hypothetical protein